MTVLCLLAGASTAFSQAQEPIAVMFDGVLKPRYSRIHFIPSKIVLTKSDFFGPGSIEIRGEWLNSAKRGWSPVIQVIGAQARTYRSPSQPLEIWNMGGLLPPEEMPLMRLHSRDRWPVYYETQSLNGLFKAGGKGTLYIDLLIRIGSKPGKLLLPALKLVP